MGLQTNALNPLTHFLDLLARFLDILDHFLGKFAYVLNYLPLICPGNVTWG